MVTFVNLAGEAEAILHVPPEMRVDTVASHAIQYLYDLRRQQLGPNSSPKDAPLIRVITQQGLDVGSNKLCRAWLISSKWPGSVVPKWMIDGEHDRRRVFFDRAHVARRQAMAQIAVVEADQREALAASTHNAQVQLD